MKVAWVHPSWRDLVIERLGVDGAARRSFLAACGIEGAMLALSTAGGKAGELDLPLLRVDADWDVLSHRLEELVEELEERELPRLLSALAAAGRVEIGTRPTAELEAVARRMLEACGHRLRGCDGEVALLVLEPWLELAAQLTEPPDPTGLGLVWIDLVPPERSGELTPGDLQRVLDWLRLAEMLARHAPATLDQLGYPDAYGARIDSWLGAAGWHEAARLDPGRRAMLAEVLKGFGQLTPGLRGRTDWLIANLAVEAISPSPAWPRVEHTHAEPSTEFDVLRVLRDL